MAESTALPLVLLAEQFARLPGIGMKSATRLAYHIMGMSGDDVREFCTAIMNAHENVHMCRDCMNFTENDICSVCEDASRDHSIICVVESPKDITAFERTREYNGVYHVLHGLISPMDRITPDMLKIRELLDRVGKSKVSEIIMALNPTVEGDATSMYLSGLIKPLGVKVTRIAFGLPVGGTLEYADEVTLYRALENRSEM